MPKFWASFCLQSTRGWTQMSWQQHRLSVRGHEDDALWIFGNRVFLSLRTCCWFHWGTFWELRIWQHNYARSFVANLSLVRSESVESVKLGNRKLISRHWGIFALFRFIFCSKMKQRKKIKLFPTLMVGNNNHNYKCRKISRVASVLPKKQFWTNS